MKPINTLPLNLICNAIETNTCQTHHEKPIAIVIGKSIKLTTCCNNFENELNRKLILKYQNCLRMA